LKKEDAEMSVFLWSVFDHLGFNYEEVKCLAVSMLISNTSNKTEKEMYDFLLKLKINYQKNDLLN
jgi:hypothetical protein